MPLAVRLLVLNRNLSFLDASKELNDVMVSHGITDATVGVRGSSVTGFGGNPRSPTFEKQFGPTSDIDLFVESSQAVNSFKKQPGFVHLDKMVDAVPGFEAMSLYRQTQQQRTNLPGGSSGCRDVSIRAPNFRS